jgi:hypothetical protein
LRLKYQFNAYTTIWMTIDPDNISNSIHKSIRRMRI